MRAHRAPAPAKVNLGLFLGPRRALDERHELVTVMQAVSLADSLTLEAGARGSEADEVICPGLDGPAEQNLAARALANFREACGWRSPPLRLRIEKRIPIAAGLAGGSADAAATLRLAAAASGLGDPGLLRELAAGLGADVSAQLQPGRWLATGAGERIAELPPPRGALELLLVPFTEGLSTASVYAEADRLELARDLPRLEGLAERLRAALAEGAVLPEDPALLENDLERAAVSLCPAIEGELARVRHAGAKLVFVSGSGPTVVGLFAGPNAQQSLAAARGSLRGRTPELIACTAAGAGAGAVERLA